MVDLFHKQKQLEELDLDLIERLGSVALSPCVPMRRIVRNKICICGSWDMLEFWYKGVKHQSQALMTIVKKLGELRQPESCDTIAQKERKKHASTLVFKCASELQATLALLCSAPVYLCGGEGVFPGEEQCQCASIKAPGIRTSIHQILESVLIVNELVVSAVKTVEHTEKRCEAFRLGSTDDWSSSRKLSNFIKSSAELDEASKIPAVLIALRLKLAGIPGLIMDGKVPLAEVRFNCKKCSSEDTNRSLRDREPFSGRARG